MDGQDVLKAEVERLREEVEAYRLRELESLRTQLAEAKAAAEHYRAEAQRNADVGRQIHAEMQAEIDRLRSKVSTAEQIPNGRPVFNRK